MTEIVVRQFVQEHCHNIVLRGDNLFADCPYCGKPKSHFNISMSTGEFHCYRCGWGGDFEKFVKYFKGKRVNMGEVVEEYTSNISLAMLQSIYNQEESAKEMFFDWVTNTESISHPKLKCQKARDYLLSRNIPLSFAQEQELRVGLEGKYDNMVIIPIKQDGKVVNFVARRFEGLGRRYDGPHNEEAIVHKSHLLYNFDNMTQSNWVIMVEGIFDAFALMLKQLPVVALMGKEISSEQIRLTMRWNKVIVLLDGGFTRDGLKVANSLEGLIDEVYVATMPEGTDPSDSPELAVDAVENAMSISCF